MNPKQQLSERDICTKYITPALVSAGWDINNDILEEVFFTDGKIYVKDKLTARGERKRADYILYYKSIPVAIIEAKDNNHGLRLNNTVNRPCSPEFVANKEYFAALGMPCVADYGYIRRGP